MWKERPSRKYRKCLVAKYMAKSSRLKALYRVSAGWSFFRKEGKRHPHLILVLLQDTSDGKLGGIYLKASGSRLLRKDKKSGFGESRLSVRESLPSSIRPSDLGRLSFFLPLQQRSKRCKKSCSRRNEAMVESDHTKKLSELTLSFRERKLTNGRDSVLKRQNS